METVTPQKMSMPVLINMYDWHTKLFKNVVDGISDKDAQNRMNTKANHIAWIAGSLVNGRYALGKFMQVDLQPASYELFKDYKGIQDNISYPSINEFKIEWDMITPLLKNAMNNLSEEQLSGPDPFKMPGGPYTFLDTIVACIDRESYCIGQIGLYRRLLGYEAMKYE